MADSRSQGGRRLPQAAGRDNERVFNRCGVAALQDEKGLEICDMTMGIYLIHLKMVKMVNFMSGGLYPS